jgi:hypothetical protein
VIVAVAPPAREMGNDAVATLKSVCVIAALFTWTFSFPRFASVNVFVDADPGFTYPKSRGLGLAVMSASIPVPLSTSAEALHTSGSGSARKAEYEPFTDGENPTSIRTCPFAGTFTSPAVPRIRNDAASLPTTP